MRCAGLPAYDVQRVNRITNILFSTGEVLHALKHALLYPRRKKNNLKTEVQSDYRPINKFILSVQTVWESCIKTTSIALSVLGRHHSRTIIGLHEWSLDCNNINKDAYKQVYFCCKPERWNRSKFLDCTDELRRWRQPNTLKLKTDCIWVATRQWQSIFMTLKWIVAGSITIPTGGARNFGVFFLPQARSKATHFQYLSNMLIPTLTTANTCADLCSRRC